MPPEYITSSIENPVLVVWDGDNDFEKQTNWSSRRKWQTTLNMSAMGFVSILLSSIAAPALQDLSDDLNMDAVEGQMALSAYVLGLAFAPLILGPCSEIVGRVRVSHVTNAWFLLWTVVTGLTRNKATMITARYVSGMRASLVYALGVSPTPWNRADTLRLALACLVTVGKRTNEANHLVCTPPSLCLEPPSDLLSVGSLHRTASKPSSYSPRC